LSLDFGLRPAHVNGRARSLCVSWFRDSTNQNRLPARRDTIDFVGADDFLALGEMPCHRVLSLETDVQSIVICVHRDPNDAVLAVSVGYSGISISRLASESNDAGLLSPVSESWASFFITMMGPRTVGR
jgi:hypothetical protein